MDPLIILGSSRRESDTKKLVDIVFKHEEYKLIDLLDYQIAAYDYGHNYPANDGFMKIMEEVLAHKVIVFATPVYWYAMSGGMKIFFDRLSDLLTFQKPTGRLVKDKFIFLLSVGANEELPPGFEVPFNLTANYMEMHFKGSIYCSTDQLNQANNLKELVEPFLKKINECYKSVE